MNSLQLNTIFWDTDDDMKPSQLGWRFKIVLQAFSFFFKFVFPAYIICKKIFIFSTCIEFTDT